MSMSRKDYYSFADVIFRTKAENRPGGDALLRVLANRMADVLERDNPRFKREQFLGACGFRGENE